MTSAFILIAALSVPTHDAVPIRDLHNNGVTAITEAMACGPHAAALYAATPSGRAVARQTRVSAFVRAARERSAVERHLRKHLSVEERSGVVFLRVSADSGLDRGVTFAAFEAAYNGWFDRQVATMQGTLRSIHDAMASEESVIAKHEKTGREAADKLRTAADADKPALAEEVRYAAGRVAELREGWLWNGRQVPAIELRLRRACRRPVVLVPPVPAAKMNAN